MYSKDHFLLFKMHLYIIIEQMEYFKSGGPILKSGKRKIEEKKEEVKIRVKIIIIIEEDQIQNLILEDRITFSKLFRKWKIIFI